MNIRKHVDRAYKHVFKTFDEDAVYDPGGDNKEIKVFPFTPDKEMQTSGTVRHEKYFMVRASDVPDPKDDEKIVYLGEEWRITEVEREDIEHFVLRCRNKERLIF